MKKKNHARDSKSLSQDFLTTLTDFKYSPSFAILEKKEAIRRARAWLEVYESVCSTFIPEGPPDLYDEADYELWWLSVQPRDQQNAAMLDCFRFWCAGPERFVDSLVSLRTASNKNGDSGGAVASDAGQLLNRISAIKDVREAFSIFIEFQDLPELRSDTMRRQSENSRHSFYVSDAGCFRMLFPERLVSIVELASRAVHAQGFPRPSHRDSVFFQLFHCAVDPAKWSVEEYDGKRLFKKEKEILSAWHELVAISDVVFRQAHEISISATCAVNVDGRPVEGRGQEH